MEEKKWREAYMLRRFLRLLSCIDFYLLLIVSTFSPRPTHPPSLPPSFSPGGFVQGGDSVAQGPGELAIRDRCQRHSADLRGGASGALSGVIGGDWQRDAGGGCRGRGRVRGRGRGRDGYKYRSRCHYHYHYYCQCRHYCHCG